MGNQLNSKSPPIWQALAEHIHEAVILLNENLEIILFNSYSEKLFDIHFSEINKHTFEAFCEKVKIQNFIDAFIGQTSPFSIQISPSSVNMNTNWCFSSVPEQNNDFYLLISQGLDYRLTQNEILKLETLIENMPCNVYWMDKNCIMIGSNQNVLNMLNLSKEQFRGKSYEELAKLCNWPEGLAENLKTDDMHVLHTGQPIIAKEDPPLPNAQGGEFNFLTSRVPLKNKNGNIIGVAGISTDVSALKEARKKAESALRSLQQSQIENTKHKADLKIAQITIEKEKEMRKTVMVLVGDIVHDLYTPLAIIGNGAEILESISSGLNEVIEEANDLKSKKLNSINRKKLNYVINEMSAAQKDSVQMINDFIKTTLRELSVAQKYKDEPISHEELTKCSSRRILENVLDSG